MSYFSSSVLLSLQQLLQLMRHPPPPQASLELQGCWYVLSPTRKETSYSDRRFWVSYILFIIIIGGILILFIYITRLASNKIFSPSNKIHREVGWAKDLSALRYIHCLLPVLKPYVPYFYILFFTGPSFWNQNIFNLSLLIDWLIDLRLGSRPYSPDVPRP
jgi:hypothetical protein